LLNQLKVQTTGGTMSEEEKEVLEAIQNGKNRDAVIIPYAEAILASIGYMRAEIIIINWENINLAIKARWSRNALIYIKTAATRLVCMAEKIIINLEGKYDEMQNLWGQYF